MGQSNDGTAQRDCWPPDYFIISTYMDHWKYLQIFQVIQIYCSKKLTPHGLIPGGDWLTEVLDPGEIDLPESQTLGRLTCRSLRPQGDWLVRESDRREIDLSGNQTAGRLTCQGIRPQEDWIAKESDCSEINLPRNQTTERLTSQGIRPQGDWLAKESDRREINSPWYLTPRRGDLIPGVSDSGRHVLADFCFDSPGSDNPES